jgi:hypothetical protein
MNEILRPTRRGFLAAFAGVIAAPAIVRVSALMPISPLPRHWMVGPGYLDSLADALSRAKAGDTIFVTDQHITGDLFIPKKFAESCFTRCRIDGAVEAEAGVRNAVISHSFIAGRA